MRDLVQWWSSPRWRAEVDPWVDAALAQAGHRRTGPTAVHRIRMWSVLLTVPTDAGTVWFKENNPSQAFEAALVAELARLSPAHVVEPLAVERERGWLLSPHGGTTLREVAADPEVAWGRVVQEYAVLQRALVDHETAVLATGVARLAPGGAAAYVLEQVDRLSALPDRHPLHLPVDVATRARTGAVRLTAAEAVLAADPLPMSLNHNDLHDGNAFVGDEGQLRFFDFGDSLWMHPLTALRVPAANLAEAWPNEPDRVARVLEGALEVWSDLVPLPVLRTQLAPAFRLASLSRYESWRRLFAEVPASELGDWTHSLTHWLGVTTAPDERA